MDVIVAKFLTVSCGTARFQSVKYKASSNAFPIYRFPPLQSHTHAGLRYENIGKDKYYFLKHKINLKENLLQVKISVGIRTHRLAFQKQKGSHKTV